MKVVIIDDEEKSTEMMRIELNALFPGEFEIISFSDSLSGISGIMEEEPDIVFLDINMPGKSGFEVLDACKNQSFQVIFATAYSEYAIQALRKKACDYILKPFDSEEIRNAVMNAKRSLDDERDHNILELLKKLSPEKAMKIPIPTSKGISFLDVQDIIYCRSESNYTHIITSNENLFVSKTLKYISSLLPQESFLRVHNSVLVSKNHVREYLKADGGSLLMSNGEQVKIASSRKGLLDDAF